MWSTKPPYSRKPNWSGTAISLQPVGPTGKSTGIPPHYLLLPTTEANGRIPRNRANWYRKTDQKNDPESHKRTTRPNTKYPTIHRRKGLTPKENRPGKPKDLRQTKKGVSDKGVAAILKRGETVPFYTHLYHHNNHKNTNGRKRQRG